MKNMKFLFSLFLYGLLSLLCSFSTLQAEKKRNNKQDNEEAKLRLLTTKGMVALQKKYGTFTVEKKFDEKIQKFMQDNIGKKIAFEKKDSITKLLTVNYIQRFSLKNEAEINTLTERLFSKVILKGGKEKEAEVIEKLNKIPTNETEKIITTVAQYLDKLIFDTWDLQVITSTKKYQITVLPKKRVVPVPKKVVPAPPAKAVKKSPNVPVKNKKK